MKVNWTAITIALTGAASYGAVVAMVAMALAK
jgi:hypothetical protein